MNTIDRRAIELEFDNSKFEKNTRSTIKALNDLDSALEMKDSTKGLTELEKVGRNFSLRNIEDNVERIASSFTLFGRTVLHVKDMLATELSGMIYRVKSFADEYVGLLTTMSQASAGFSKYEKKTSAVQAIRSALPDTDLSTITKALEDLNKYTDETSYDFTEMVNTIGKFTANGVKLEDAVEAMKGIGNEAAKSGASIQEANRAMYNFAQALATGSVKLIDWKSIENANMATKEFKEQIIDTALELGILRRQGDKIVTKKGTLVDFTTFSTTLNEGWFTSDVLTKVLGKYADVTTEFGLAAFHAAQQAKTFTEAIDAVKDAASTGWMKTYELIFGNLEEAIELFTGLANRLIEITDAVSEWRNGLLEGWRELGGRKDLIQGLTDAFEALWNIVRIVGEGIRDVFPETTAEDLKRFTESIKNFGAGLRETFGIKDYAIDQVKHFKQELHEEFEELNGTLRYGANGDEVKKLQERLKKLGYDLGDAGVDGIFGPKTEAALKQFQEDYGLAIDGIYGKLSHTKLGELMADQVTWVMEKTQIEFTEYSGTMEKLRKIVSGGSAVISIFGKALKFVWNVLKRIGTALKPLADIFLTMFSVIGDWLTDLNKKLEESTIFTEWLENIGAWLEPLSGWLKNAGDSFLKFFGFVKTEEDANEETATFSTLLEKMKQRMKDSGVFDRFASAIEKIREAFGKAKAALSGYFEEAKKYLKEKLLTKTDEDGNEVTMSYADVLGNIGSFLGDTFAGFLDIVAGVIDKIPENVERIKDFFADLFGSLQIPADFHSVIQKVTDFFTGIFEAIASLFGNDKGTISTISGTGQSLEIGSRGTIEKKFDFLEWLANTWNNFVSGAGQLFESIADFVDRHDIVGKIQGLLLSFQGLFIGKALLNFSKIGKGLVEVGQTFADAKQAQAKAGKWKAIASALKSLALVIGVVAASIYILGNIDPEKLKRGALTVGGIIGVVALFAVLTRVLSAGKGEDAFKSMGSTLKGLAVAIGVITYALFKLSKMMPMDFLSGMWKIAVMLAALAAFTKIVGSTKMDLKGLIGVAVAIGVMTLSVKSLAKLSLGGAIKGLGSMFLLLTMLGAFMKTATKETSSIKMAGMIGFAVAIGVLVAAVKILGSTKTDVLIKGVLGMLAVVKVLSSFIKNAGKLNAKQGLQSLLALIGISATMVAFSYSLNRIKDVDTDKIVAFSAGISAILLSLGAFMKMTGAAGLAGVGAGLLALIGVIAVIAAVIAAFAGLSKIKGFQEFMNSGAESIGEIIGSFMGSLQAAEIRSFNKGLASFNEIEAPDQNKIKEALAAAQLLADFKEGLPDHGIVQQIVDWIGNSKIEQLAEDMMAFSTGFAGFQSVMSEIHTDNDELKENTAFAIEIAEQIAKFADGLGTPTWEETFSTWIKGSALDILSKDMGTFAEGFNGYCESLMNIGEDYGKDDIIGKTGIAVTIATKIADFLDKLDKLGIEGKKGVIGEWLTGPNQTDSFFDYLSEFGTTMKESVTSFSGLSTGTFLNDAITAKTIAEEFVKFFTYLSSDEVDINNDKRWGIFGKDSTFTKMVDQFSTLGEKISQFADNVSGIDGQKLLNATTAIKAIADSLALVSLSDSDAPDRLTRALSTLIPWMPDFVEYGKLIDENVASGLTENQDVVSNAALALKNAILSALELTADDISSALVITPVLDMSNVDSGVKSLRHRSLSVGGLAKTTQKTIGSAEQTKMNQGNVVNNDINASSTVTVTGNTFEIQKESDITALANKIAALVNQQQRGFGSVLSFARR